MAVFADKCPNIQIEVVDLNNIAHKSSKTTTPFLKNNEFDYHSLTSWMGDKAKDYAWILFVLIIIVIITAVSNGANMTDGLDGLATGVSAIIGITLSIFAYVSGNIIAADYLNIMYIIVWSVFSRKFICHNTGRLFQVYKKEVWSRKKSF